MSIKLITIHHIPFNEFKSLHEQYWSCPHCRKNISIKFKQMEFDEDSLWVKISKPSKEEK